MKKILLRISLVCMMLISFSSTTLAADWQRIASTTEQTVFFDRFSIREVRKGVYNVWFKSEYSEDHSKKLAKGLHSSETPAYTVYLIKIDSKSSTLEYSTYYTYSRAGKLINAESLKFTVEIIPETIGELFFKATYPEYRKQFG